MSDFDMNWIEQYLKKPPKVIFDIGCYNGIDSMMFKQKYPQAEVYSFEASPTTYSRLIANPSLTKNLKIYHYAMSNFIGEIDFHDSYGINDCSGSILESQHKRTDLKFKTPVKVPTTTIEKFCQDNDIKEIDLIHMDVQGAEFCVMQGIGNMRPKMIFCETAEYDNYKNAGTLEDFDDLMGDAGYMIEKVLQYDTLFLHRSCHVDEILPPTEVKVVEDGN